jgi:Tfp pilus assembly protein PilX
MRNEKGSALIMVILVVVVLTMVGLAAAFYMNMEDRISQNDKLLQAALQAAQAGLKEGEQIVSRTVTNATINTALDPATHGNYSGNDLPTAQTDLTTAQHLGVVLWDQNSSSALTPLYNVNVGGVSVASVSARYTLYLRNDPSDYLPASDSGKYYIDHNGRINLISRGSVIDAKGREIAVKILTEQIYFGLSNVKPGQFRFGQLGTSATQY